MSKDDYFAIVYKILKYLYYCLKKGYNVNDELLTPEALNISNDYHFYIFDNIQAYGYIKGIYAPKTFDKNKVINFISIEITPKGIEYLCENNTLNKYAGIAKEIIHIIKP